LVKLLPNFNALVLANLCKYCDKSYTAKNQIPWGTFFVRDSIGLGPAVTVLTSLALKTNALGEVMQNNSHQ